MGDLTGETLLDKYKLTALLGRGGMGAVYQGTHLRTGRKVAVKVLDDRFLANRSIVQRFGREARAASSIEHPGIVEVLDLDLLPGGPPFLVMELLDGETLASFVEKKQRLTQAEALEIFDQLLEALEAAHERGIVHRDLKPDNIFLLPPSHSGKRVVKILDFGISQKADEVRSHLTQTGAVLGTPHYMSPEQALGETALDARADLYAAGIVLYECVVGEVPYDAGNYNALLQSILRATPPRPREKGAKIEPAFEEALLVAMSKEKAKRPASAAAWRAMLIEANNVPRTRTSIAPRYEKPTSIAPPGSRPTDLESAISGSLDRGTPSESPPRWGEFATLGSRASRTPTPSSYPPPPMGAPPRTPVPPDRAVERIALPNSASASSAGKELDDFDLAAPGPSLELDDAALASPGRGRVSRAPDARGRSYSGTLAAPTTSSAGTLSAMPSSPGVLAGPRHSSSGSIPAVTPPRRPSGAAFAAVALPSAPSTSSGSLSSPGIPGGDLPLPDDAPTAPPQPTLIERVMALPRALRLGVVAVLALGAIIVAIRFAVRHGSDDDQLAVVPVPTVPVPPTGTEPVALPQTVLVDIAGLPQRARVKLDGLPVGVLPLRVRRGEHHVLEIEAPGYDARRIAITPNEDLRVSADMRPSM